MHDTNMLRQDTPRRALAIAAALAAALMLAACGGGGGGGSTAQPQAPAAQPQAAPDPEPAADPAPDPEPAAQPAPDPEPKPEPAATYDPVHGPYDPSIGRHVVDIERNSFDDVGEVFALGGYVSDSLPGTIFGTSVTRNPLPVTREGGEIYIPYQRSTGYFSELRGGEDDRRAALAQGTHIRETEHRYVSGGTVHGAWRETIATGARIERGDRDDYVTFGWWYRMVGKRFADSAPDHGRPSSVSIQAFADGPEFNRLPDTFPTGRAEYEGPAIGLHSTLKDGKHTTEEFSGTARFSVNYGGGRGCCGVGEISSPTTGNISIDGERVISICCAVSATYINHRTGRFGGAKEGIAGVTLHDSDLPFSSGGAGIDGINIYGEISGEISGVLEGGFPRAIIGTFAVEGFAEDPGAKGAVVTHRESYIGAYHAPLVVD